MPQPSWNPAHGTAFVHVGIVDVVVVICKGIPKTINTEVDGITLSKLSVCFLSSNFNVGEPGFDHEKQPRIKETRLYADRMSTYFWPYFWCVFIQRHKTVDIMLMSNKTI